MMAFFEEIKDFIKDSSDDAALKKDFLDPLKAASKDLQTAAMYFVQQGMKNPNHALAGSTDFLHLFGHVALGYMWARMAKVCIRILAENDDRADMLNTKLATGRYYMLRRLPATRMHLARIESGADPVMALKEEDF